MATLWLISIPLRDVSIVDPFWGTGFVVVAWLSFLNRLGDDWRSLLLALMTTIWGLRLSLYLLWRNWGHGEDRRYVEMREYRGNNFWWMSLFSVFLLQGLILLFVSLPLQAAAVHDLNTPLGLTDIVGLVLWGIGLLFETVGDWQLARFKADPANKGRVMDRGLWRFTRHPNYFGDICVWWGLYVVAFGAGGWWTVLSPAVMTFFLMRVSGVTLLEKTIVDRRPEYADYIKRTNALFPGPPRPKSSP
jgi:steroid 5-alpha reductase family enzyme